jgi:uncharacterized protein YkwD
MRFRRAAALAVGLTTLGTTTPATAQSPKHDSVERSVIRKLNQIRAQSGLRGLRGSRGLARAADAKSASMAATGDFTHGAMGPRVRRYVRAGSIGETLASVPLPLSGDASAIVDMWLRSPSHRATLLSGRFARVGVARRYGRGSVFFTVDLASAR